MQEFKALYAAACQGIAPQLSPPGRFSAYAVRQAQQQHAPETMAAEAYWLGQFHDRVPLLALPTDHPRPLVQTYAGARQEIQIAEALHQALKDLSAQRGCTLFMTLLAGLQVLLHRLTGQDDIVVGIAAVEPASASGKNLVGYATNLLPLRSRVRATLTCTDYLTMVKQTVFDAYTHQSFSVLRLIDKLQLPHDPGRPPLISAVFNIDYSGTAPEFFALEVDMVSPPSGAVECDTFWNVTEAANGLFVACDYNTDLFDVDTIRRWLGHYQTVLASLLANPDQRLDVCFIHTRPPEESG
jgi:non-ribosomal peptide synthetase component F